MKKLIFLSFLLVSLPMYAQTSDQLGSKERLIMPKDNSARCQVRTNKIQAKINMMKANKEARTRLYEDILTKFKSLSAKFKDKGLSTSKLDTQIDSLSTKIKDFNSLRDAYIASLTEAELKAFCTRTEDEFKTALMDSKNKHKELIAKAQEIRKFIINEVTPEIKSLRLQLSQLKETKQP